MKCRFAIPMAILILAILSGLTAVIMKEGHHNRHLVAPERIGRLPADRPRPASDPGVPDVEVSADGELRKIAHKDTTGRATLEFRETQEGTVRIQRTFSDDGKLLQERAMLNGKVVPVPSS